MPTPTNLLIETEFVVSTGPDNKKSSYLICKHCTKYNKARNTTRALEHLYSCPGFKAKQEASVDTTNPSQKQ